MSGHVVHIEVSAYCYLQERQLQVTVQRLDALSNSYTMGCPPVRADNPRALGSGLS